jgi:ribosome-associated protein
MTPTKTTTPKRARAASAAKPATPAKRIPRKKAAARPALVDLVVAALEDLKGQNVTVLDVRGLSDVADTIVIASGTSDRHVKSLAGSVYAKAKAGGFRPIGMEGEQEGEWVLVDLQDAIVHVMLPRVREFYGLEKLWDVREGSRAAG